MIKNIKETQSAAFISSEIVRGCIENFQREILRGIGPLIILNIIHYHGDDGIYGYKLLKELESKTNKMLIIEEGTLYPILRKFENRDNKKKIKLLTSEKKRISGRERKYYRMTKEGFKIYNYLIGFFSKLIESISGLLQFNIQLNEEMFLYCPNCSNKIDLNRKMKFCNICGYEVKGIEEGVYGGKNNE